MAVSPIAVDAVPLSQSAGDKKTLADNYDAFLVLLTTQLQNQDPTSPMDSTQFTQQLVQFSQVEQQIRTNEHLESLASQYQAASAGAALSYLGRDAMIESDKTALGSAGAQWGYSLDPGAVSTTLTVTDARGRILLETRGDSAAGAHVFNWDGRDANGVPAAPGAYRLTVGAKNSNGDNVKATMSVRETIRGVDFSGPTPVVITASGARELGLIRAVLDD
jgi:flagellar basal-body rod modification protein FlgD